MSVHVVLNTQTAADAQRTVQTWVDAHADATLSATRSAEEARIAVRQAVDAGTDRLIAAGGDGTLSLVAGTVLDRTRDPERSDPSGTNGLPKAPVVGLCPLGTGDDFARSLGLPTSPDKALDRAAHGEPVWIDVLRAEAETDDIEPRWGVNAAAGGFSGEVDEVISREQKDRWGALAFIIGAADVVPDIPKYATEIRYTMLDGEEARWSGNTVNVICANGRTIGGGRSVAPSARLDDGCFELVVVRHGDLPDLARTAARLLAGAWEEDDQVDILRVRSAHIRAVPGLTFNVDGDLWTERPVSVTTVPRALRVVAGPNAPALRG